MEDVSYTGYRDYKHPLMSYISNPFLSFQTLLQSYNLSPDKIYAICKQNTI